MSIELTIAISAVVIGWLLNELSGVFRIARVERQYVSSSMVPLLYLYFEQIRINEILTFFNNKMGKDFEKLYEALKENEEQRHTVKEMLEKYMKDFEEIRRINSAMPERNLNTLLDSSTKAIESLSRVSPELAYKANKLVREFVLFTEIEMPEAPKDTKVYMAFYGNILSVFRSDMDELKKLIYRLSFKISVIQFFRIYRLIKLEKKEVLGGMVKVYDNTYK